MNTSELCCYDCKQWKGICAKGHHPRIAVDPAKDCSDLKRGGNKR